MLFISFGILLVVLFFFSVHEICQIFRGPLRLAFAFGLLVGLVHNEALQQGVHSDGVDGHEEHSHHESDYCHHLNKEGITMTCRKG